MNDILISEKGIQEQEEEVPLSQTENSFLGLKTKNNLISKNSKNFLNKYFPLSSEEDWNNWKWQVKNSFVTYKQLQQITEVTEVELEIFLNRGMNLPFRITPYYASLMINPEFGYIIRKAMVPTNSEMIISPGEEPDPLHEEDTMPVPNIVHRYPDRVLFLATNFCSSYCRYCTRSHMVAKEEKHYEIKAWEEAFEYIKNHKEIRDVLISGGDPLTISDGHINYLLSKLRNISHVEIIRIGTKVPVVLPQRITPELIDILKKYHPLYLSIHFMHPEEITLETSEALNKLADAGIPLGSQTVLLKGINDDIEIMKNLMHKLLMNRIKPYYIYSCDKIPGSKQFQSTIDKGLEIIDGLRGNTSGYACPQFVIDSNIGKIALLPNFIKSLVETEENKIYIFRNYKGEETIYKDFK